MRSATAFPPNWPARLAWLGLAVYVVYAASILDVTWERFVSGIHQGARFVSRMFPPDVAPDKLELMMRGLYESLEIAIIASALGILLSLPIGLLAARNLMPPWLTWPVRLLIAFCRSFHQVIVAILFVKAVGFGALAGILALTVGSVGFVAKLFAEAIEEISLAQVEAIRATGASFMNVVIYSVMPQVLTRFVGFATYQVDSNLRNSTMVGIVGAGGIGGTMFAAFQKFDYDYLLTILLAIIAMIMLSEMLQNAVKEAVPMSTEAVLEREWQRFTTAQRLGRFALYFGIIAACVVSLRTIQVIPEFLYDAPEQMADLFKRMWPIEWAFYPKGVHDALIETLHIASLGTILAVLMAVPLGILAANNIVPNSGINYLAKLMLVSSRSVNSLVWALLFVAIFGPGPLAGTMAIAFRSIGFVGKLFGEALEETRPGPVEALSAAGAPWPSIFLKGYWPQVVPAFWGITLFRWDINVRESAVLGLVGAGGIGMAIDTAMNLFQWERVALMLVAIFTVVVVAELVVTAVRKRLI